MIHQELLRRAVPQDDYVLIAFVDNLAPPILTYLASVPALGGSGKPPVIEGLEVPAGLRTYTAQDYARLTKGGKQEDQSMATHLLNGIFAAMRLARWLPANKQLTDLDKRLWILGYICHDYAKIYGIQISAGEIPLIKQLIERLGALMNFDSFLTEWRDYLGDIAFLAQNTQTKEGSNLRAPLFQPKHDLRRLETLRLLSSIADVLVHIKSPAEVAIALERSTDQNIHEKMIALFGAERAPRFTYHKLTEVRGLLSNIINNAVMNEMKAQGAEPFLFFPNGVVYLITQTWSGHASPENAANSVWERLLSVIGDDENFGIRRGGTGFVVSSALSELIGVERVLQTAKRKALKIVSGYADARLYGYFTGKSKNDLLKDLGNDEDAISKEQNRVVNDQKLPHDVRVDQIGEFLTFAYRLFDKEHKIDITPLLLKELGLEGKVTPQDALKQKGGTYFGWYYVAAKYVEVNPQIDTAQIDNLLDTLCDKLVASLATQKTRKKKSAEIRDFITQYILEHLEIYGENRSPLSFADELANYVQSKQAKKPICSMCVLPYPSILQEANETLFVTQQYSNKNPLGHTTVVRGICPVCRIEMILRKIAHPQADEKQKPIFMWIYPTYFFTLETSNVVREFRNRFWEVSQSPRDLLIHLSKSDFSVANLLAYERFLSTSKDEDETADNSPRFSEHDFAGISHLVLRPPKPPEGKKLTDTDQWAIPTLHTLILPLLLDVKIVATSSFVPLFSSGAEFPETAVLDAPHQFTRYVLGKDRFRVDELPQAVIRLLRLYDLHLDVYGDGKKSHWPQINEVAAAVKTDPLNVFMYYDRKKRDSGKKKSKGKQSRSQGGAKSNQLVPLHDIERYYQIYLALGGEENMGIIGQLVDAYAAFYRTRTFKKEPSAYAVVRPLHELINATLKTDPEMERDDLALTLAGTLADVMERVWNNSIKDASDPIIFERNSSRPMHERKQLSRQKQEEFVELFLSSLFEGRCHGQRSVLQENANRYRSAAKFYYLKHYYYSNSTEANHD